MFNLKKVSFSLATAVLTITIGTLYSTSAQAAIMWGQVSGIWNIDNDGVGGLSVGDTFTFDYTYDSDSATTVDNSVAGHYTSEIRTALLLSAVLNSGSLSHIFDLSYSVGNQYISWNHVQSTSPTYGQVNYVTTTISSQDGLAPGWNYFYIRNALGKNFSGNPLINSFSSFIKANSYSDMSPLASAISYNANISPEILVPTSVPTPALLPGLIGLGVSALRRRKKIETVAE